MAKLDELIEELCPNGVEYILFSSMCEIVRGERITKSVISVTGDYPVLSGGQNPMGRYDKYNREANTITIASYGVAGYVGFQTERFWANDVCLCLYPQEGLNNKFLYYFLCSQQNYFYSKTTKAIPDHIPTSVIRDLQIPLPPLAVQCEIVRILDDYAERVKMLQCKLQEELDARCKQYRDYRDKLLSFEKSNEGYEVRWLKLGEICDTITDYVAAGSFADLKKNVQYLQNADYAQLVRTRDLKSKFKNEDFVYIAETAYNYLWRVHLDQASIIMPNIGNCGEVYYVDPQKLPYQKNALGPNAILLRSSKEDNKYLYYIFQCEQFQKQLKLITSPGGQCKFNKTDLKKLIVPVPPLEVQEKIVEMLDKFDKLCNDLSEGLPAEIEARQKQYEYYRDNLLTFEEKSDENF